MLMKAVHHPPHLIGGKTQDLSLHNLPKISVIIYQNLAFNPIQSQKLLFNVLIQMKQNSSMYYLATQSP